MLLRHFLSGFELKFVVCVIFYTFRTVLSLVIQENKFINIIILVWLESVMWLRSPEEVAQEDESLKQKTTKTVPAKVW